MEGAIGTMQAVESTVIMVGGQLEECLEEPSIACAGARARHISWPAIDMTSSTKCCFIGNILCVA